MTEDQLKTILDQQLAVFFGELTRHIDAQLEKKADRDQVERLQTTLDGLAKRLDTDDQERAAIVSQLNRHEAWIARASDKLQIGYDQAA